MVRRATRPATFVPACLCHAVPAGPDPSLVTPGWPLVESHQDHPHNVHAASVASATPVLLFVQDSCSRHCRRPRASSKPTPGHPPGLVRSRTASRSLLSDRRIGTALDGEATPRSDVRVPLIRTPDRPDLHRAVRLPVDTLCHTSDKNTAKPTISFLKMTISTRTSARIPRILLSSAIARQPMGGQH